MSIKRLVKIASAWLMVAASSAALAAPVTFDFSGTVKSGGARTGGGNTDWTGVSFTASYTIDLSAPGVSIYQTSDETQGAWLNRPHNSSSPPPNATVSILFSNGYSASFGSNGDFANDTVVGIYKESGGSRNQYFTSITSTGANFLSQSLQFGAFDDMGSASTLFSEPGFALDQNVNIFANGATIFASFDDGLFNRPGVSVMLNIATMNPSRAVPEPATPLLVLIGVCGLLVARFQHPRARGKSEDRLVLSAA